MAKETLWKVYFNDELFPVTPGKITETTSGNNQTASLIDGTNINILKSPKLKEFSMELLFPNQEYPFTVYEDGFHEAEYYHELLCEAMRDGESASLTITRHGPGGTDLDGVDLDVSVEKVSAVEDAGKTGFDKTVTVSFKEYVHYGTKTFRIPEPVAEEPQAAVEETPRDDSSAPSTQTYTVKQGDTLWAIAAKYYGNGSDYGKIYSANTDVIESTAQKYGMASSQGGHWIYPGEELTIPE